MTLSQHVTRQRLSQRLHEAGIVVESYFCWELETEMIQSYVERNEDYIAAPMASELAELLPDVVKVDGKSYELSITKQDDYYFVVYQYPEEHGEYRFFDKTGATGETLADAIAVMLLKLREKGLI